MNAFQPVSNTHFPLDAAEHVEEKLTFPTQNHLVDLVDAFIALPVQGTHCEVRKRSRLPEAE